MIEHRGYVGRIEEIGSDGVIYGVVVNLSKDHIEFEGRSSEELIGSFRQSVDFYLEGCEKDGLEPDTPFSGRFVVRLDADVHRRLHALSRANGESLNSTVVQAIEHELDAHGLGSGIDYPGTPPAEASSVREARPTHDPRPRR